MKEVWISENKSKIKFRIWDNKNKRFIKSIYANGIEFFDELFKGNEESSSYKFVEVD